MPHECTISFYVGRILTKTVIIYATSLVILLVFASSSKFFQPKRDTSKRIQISLNCGSGFFIWSSTLRGPLLFVFEWPYYWRITTILTHLLMRNSCLISHAPNLKLLEKGSTPILNITSFQCSGISLAFEFLCYVDMTGP